VSETNVANDHGTPEFSVLAWEKQHNRRINQSAVGCLIVVASQMALSSIPERAPWMSEVGELATNLCLAFLTGWFFHLLVIVLPERQRRARLERIVARRIDYLLRAGFDFAKPLSRTIKAGSPSFPLSAESVTKACALITPGGAPPGWPPDWYGLVRHLGNVTDTQRLALQPFYPRLDEDLLGLLEDEELAFLHLRRVNKMASAFEAENLSALAPWIIGWLKAISALHTYRLTHLRTETAPPAPDEDEEG